MLLYISYCTAYGALPSLSLSAFCCKPSSAIRIESIDRKDDGKILDMMDMANREVLDQSDELNRLLYLEWINDVDLPLRRTTKIVTRSWFFSTTGQSCTNPATSGSCSSRLFFFSGGSFSSLSFLFLVGQSDFVVVIKDKCLSFVSICSLSRGFEYGYPDRQEIRRKYYS